MEEYLFQKSFKLDKIITKVSEVTLEHDFKNHLSEDGVRIEGNIYLKFNLNYGEETEKKELTIPVDLFIALNKIDCLKELKLNITDFNYEIKDNEIFFKVYAKLKGNNEDFICFEPTQNREINNEMVSLLMRNEINKPTDFQENYLKSIEDLIKKEDVDLISTPFENLNIKEKDIINISTLEEDDSQESIANPLPEICKPIEESKKEEPIKKEETLTDNKPPKEELFKEEYTSKYFFYRLKDNENLDTIVSMFSLKKEELINLNKNIEFKKGNLIKIPK